LIAITFPVLRGFYRRHDFVPQSRGRWFMWVVCSFVKSLFRGFITSVRLLVEYFPRSLRMFSSHSSPFPASRLV